MIATQNTGQGMQPLLQLLGGEAGDLKALEGLQGLDAQGLLSGQAEGGASFLDVLEPQIRALLSGLGTPGEELEGMDLGEMLARLRELLEGSDLATGADAGGKELPLAALIGHQANAPSADPRAEGGGRLPAANVPADSQAAEAGREGMKPLPAALLRLFVEASQGSREDVRGALSERQAGGGMPGAPGRDAVTEVLAQWLTQAAESGRGRSESGGSSVAQTGQAGEPEAGRALRLDMTRLLQSGGDRELADRVRMLAQAQGGRTELKLHPPQLGTLDVRVSVDGDRATVQFVSANPVTREVLEAALPRLRDSLAEGGLKLDDATVSDQAADEQPDQQDSESGFGDASVAEEQESAAQEGTRAEGSTLSILNRRLDLFA
ncbi:MAG: flagellar hook-length control protein FliK [Pseudomonadota bacterium]